MAPVLKVVEGGGKPPSRTAVVTLDYIYGEEDLFRKVEIPNYKTHYYLSDTSILCVEAEDYLAEFMVGKIVALEILDGE